MGCNSDNIEKKRRKDPKVNQIMNDNFHDHNYFNNNDLNESKQNKNNNSQINSDVINIIRNNSNNIDYEQNIKLLKQRCKENINKLKLNYEQKIKEIKEKYTLIKLYISLQFYNLYIFSFINFIF